MADNYTIQTPEVEVKPSINPEELYKIIGGGQEQKPTQALTSESLYDVMSKAPTQDEMSLADVAAQAYQNLGPSGIEMGKNIYGAIRHPITTAGSILDLATGGIHNLMPEDVARWIDAHDTDPEATKKAVETANAVGKFYKERYGSSEGFKKALAQDPVGVASDISALLSGGATIAGKVGAPAKAIATLEKAADVTNPILATAKGTAAVGKAGLGLLTGTSPETIAQAGKSGLINDPDFWRHVKGEGELTEPLDNARFNLNQMKMNKSNEYRSGMTDISKDKSILNFDDINKSVKDAKNSISFKGQTGAEVPTEVHEKLSKIVNDWQKLDPAKYHTPEGLDFLKQKIGDYTKTIGYEHTNANRIGSEIYNSIKNTISKQAPTYSKVMSDYTEASEQIREIEKALSLGGKASADTALRKLQSLTRNNVSTNYGQRMNLAQQLEQEGGKPFISMLAGQALSSPTARGLAGAGELATILGSFYNPAALAVLPLQTPKLVGMGLYKAGQAGAKLGNIGAKAGINATRANTLSSILNAINRTSEE